MFREMATRGIEMSEGAWKIMEGGGMVDFWGRLSLGAGKARLEGSFEWRGIFLPICGNGGELFFI